MSLGPYLRGEDELRSMFSTKSLSKSPPTYNEWF